jgi:VanZ family protein
MIVKILQKPYLALLYSFLVLGLCIMPSENIPSDVDDKMAHFVSFAGISFLWLWVSPNYMKVIIASIVFGFIIEFTQRVLPDSFHRSFDVYDGLADAVGALIGVGLFYVANLLLNTKKGGKDPF